MRKKSEKKSDGTEHGHYAWEGFKECYCGVYELYGVRRRHGIL